LTAWFSFLFDGGNINRADCCLVSIFTSVEKISNWSQQTSRAATNFRTLPSASFMRRNRREREREREEEEEEENGC
jgi:hypothetical protein